VPNTCLASVNVRYQGGKSRIARKIVAEIRKFYPQAEDIWEPFCGGGAMTKALAEAGFKVHASDSHPDLIMMWWAMCAGQSEVFADVTEEEYRDLRDAPSSARRGFVGYSTSFGAKWFGGWARDTKAKRNFAAEARRDNLALIEHKHLLTFTHADYRETPDAVLCYCDKPYAGTLDYKGEPFYHDVFWRWVARRSGPTFISELSRDGCDDIADRGLGDLRIVWRKEHLSQNASNSPTSRHRGAITREERLYYLPPKAERSE